MKEQTKPHEGDDALILALLVIFIGSFAAGSYFLLLVTTEFYLSPTPFSYGTSQIAITNFSIAVIGLMLGTMLLSVGAITLKRFIDLQLPPR